MSANCFSFWVTSSHLAHLAPLGYSSPQMNSPDAVTVTAVVDKCLANAKRPCNCSNLLCLRPKSSLCNSPHCNFGTSFGSANSVRRASNNGLCQFKPIFQVEENTFRHIFFGYFIDDWLLYNLAAGCFHTIKLCSRLYSIEIEFYSEKLKNGFLSHPWGTWG